MVVRFKDLAKSPSDHKKNEFREERKGRDVRSDKNKRKRNFRTNLIKYEQVID